jgi:hypothetical protein
MSHLNIFPYMDVKHSKGQKFRNGHWCSIIHW